MSKSSLGWRLLALLLALAMVAAACGSDDEDTDAGADDSAEESTDDAADDEAEEDEGEDDEAMEEGDSDVSVSLITKDSTNPFFVAMQEGAQQKADELGIEISIGSGQAEGDDAGQIELIEAAIAQGQDGILITPMSVNVNDAILKAREAGLFVIALDTPTDPPDVVDITFATDNCKAGDAIGQWAAGKLNGEKAIIARLIIFDDRTVSVDYCRDNGFLRGMGIDIGDLTVIGEDVIIVSVDGGLAGVEAVQGGSIQATSQQYPLRMASLGVEAIFEIATGGAPPENTSDDGTFFDTGVTLCTDEPMDTVTVAPVEGSQYCIDNAWG